MKKHAQALASLQSKFDALFQEIPFLSSFRFDYGARWPDPHSPMSRFDFQASCKPGSKASPAALRVVSQMVHDALLSSGCVLEVGGEEWSEYKGAHPDVDALLKNVKFVEGARLVLPAPKSEMDPSLGIALAARRKLGR